MTLAIIVVIFGLLATLAGLSVTAPLWRNRGRNEVDPAAADVAACRTRIAELEQDHEAGLIDAEAYAEARAEAERALLAALDDESSAGYASRAGRRRDQAAILACALVLPVIAGGIYTTTGRPGLLLGGPGDGEVAERAEALQQIRDGLPKIRQRVAAEPGDVRAWSMLTNAYLALGRPEDAVATTARGLMENPDSPQLLVARARALAASNDGELGADAVAALDRALQQAPARRGALWLRGLAAARSEDFESARTYWQRLRRNLPPAADSSRVDSALAQLPGAARVDAPPAPNNGAETGAAPSGDGLPSIRVRVRLVEGLEVTAPAETTVFVFARQPAGGAMPVAAARTQLAELPTTVVLDTAMAQAADRSLAVGDRVDLVARISKAGGVQAAEGDWQGRKDAQKIDPEQVVTVVIDQKL